MSILMLLLNHIKRTAHQQLSNTSDELFIKENYVDSVIYVKNNSFCDNINYISTDSNY